MKSLSALWCMQVAMNRMGNRLNDNELRQLIATADVDGNGTIDYEEFVAATVNLNKLEKEEHCMEVHMCCTAGQACSCKWHMWHLTAAQLLPTTSVAHLHVCSTGVCMTGSFISCTTTKLVVVRLTVQIQVQQQNLCVHNTRCTCAASHAALTRGKSFHSAKVLQPTSATAFDFGCCTLQKLQWAMQLACRIVLTAVPQKSTKCMQL